MILDSVRKFFDDERRRGQDRSRARDPRRGPRRDEGARPLRHASSRQEYGGIGLSRDAPTRASMQEVGGLDASLAVTLGAHQSIGLKGILLFGTEAQKSAIPAQARDRRAGRGVRAHRAVGRLRRRRHPDARRARARRQRLHRSTARRSGSPTAASPTCSPCSRAPRPPTRARSPRSPRSSSSAGMGVKNGPHEHKLGIRGSSTTEVFFDDVHVPAENVLGEVGRGFKVAMEVLNSGRLGLAAGCVGMCKRLIKMAVERVQERKAFGRPIGEFGLIKDKIARDDGRDVRARVDDLPHGGPRRRQGRRLLARERDLQGVRRRRRCGASSTRRCRSPPASATCRSTPTSASCATRASTSSSRAPTRSCAASSRSRACRARARSSPRWCSAMREPIKGFGLLSRFRHPQGAHGARPRAHDAARTRCSTARRWSSRSTPPSSRSNVDKVLRKHGKRHRRDAVHAEARRRDGDGSLRHRRVPLAHDARHRAAGRGGRAPRDRPHDGRSSARREKRLRQQRAPRSTRTTTSCARRSRSARLRGRRIPVRHSLSGPRSG